MRNVVDEMTNRLLVDAGLRPGMHVVDGGCGRGDVTFMIAQLVGARGRVLGVDRDAEALVVARNRALQMGLSNVGFELGDLATPSPGHGLFDAAVGRRVLMYQRDAVESVRGLAGAVRSGGTVVFQEHDASMTPISSTPLALHERARSWIWRTIEREGGNLHMGVDLEGVLVRAGLVVDEVRAEAVVETPTTRYPTGYIVQVMLPRILRHGVASEEEMGIDTLDQRLLDEIQNAHASYVGELVFGAWARKPA